MIRLISVLLMFVCAFVSASNEDIAKREAEKKAADQKVSDQIWADAHGAHGVTIKEAKRRSRLTKDSRPFIRLVEYLNFHYFGGIYFEHEPEHKLIVNVTDMNYEQDILDLIDYDHIRNFVEVRKVDLTESELDDLREKVEKELKDKGIVFDSATDIKTSDVEIYTTDKEAKNFYKDKKNVKIIIVDELAQPAFGVITGGVLLKRNNEICTTGFSVYEPAGRRRKGFITASHCSNYLKYQGTETTLIGEHFGTKYDVQFMTVKSFYPLPEINKCREGNCLIGIKGKVLRKSQKRGDRVCKFGVTTNYTCGELVRTNYKPSEIIPRASASFGLVENHNYHMVQAGDSGGPVINPDTNEAYGIVTGSSWIGNGKKRLVYMPIDEISGANGGNLELMIER